MRCTRPAFSRAYTHKATRGHAQHAAAAAGPRRVSLSRELDSTDSSSAADLAVDAMVAQLADVGAPLQKKHRTAALITVVLQPSADGGRSQTLG